MYTTRAASSSTENKKEKKPIQAKPATPTSTAVAAPVPAVIKKMDIKRLAVSLSSPSSAQMANVIAGVSTCIQDLSIADTLEGLASSDYEIKDVEMSLSSPSTARMVTVVASVSACTQKLDIQHAKLIPRTFLYGAGACYRYHAS